MQRLPGKRAVITGAASGLGRAIALELAKDSWRIAIADINEARARETLDLVQQAGGGGEVIYCDVTDVKQIEAVAEKFFTEWDGVDLLVNNAGVLSVGYIGDISIADWEWVIKINLWGPILGCHVFIPRFKRQGYGHILNVASNAGIASLPEMGSYNLTKAAVISLSETLRTELSPANIGVTALCPTFFSTNLMESARSTTDEQVKLAQHMFDTASMNTAQIARFAVKAVKKNKLYVVPQADGKFVWFFKRFSPSLYFRALGYLYRRGLKKWVLKD